MTFQQRIWRLFSHKTSDVSIPSSSKSSNGSPKSTSSSSKPSKFPLFLDQGRIQAPMTAAKKYLLDPMRFNDSPDRVGSFVDPMGGPRCYAVSIDPTNTGA
ncbi:hypothetical protein VTP01DRAFT_10434 [Rhizomucor pusillus]|uniref:uncharacterized protein n=1 Tax=Rhizomucor pusillus TaxID=4840 RepID=UPI003742CBB7